MPANATIYPSALPFPAPCKQGLESPWPQPSRPMPLAAGCVHHCGDGPGEETGQAGTHTEPQAGATPRPGGSRSDGEEALKEALSKRLCHLGRTHTGDCTLPAAPAPAGGDSTGGARSTCVPTAPGPPGPGRDPAASRPSSGQRRGDAAGLPRGLLPGAEEAWHFKGLPLRAEHRRARLPESWPAGATPGPGSAQVAHRATRLARPPGPLVLPVPTSPGPAGSGGGSH